jgi:hypothetical protein
MEHDVFGLMNKAIKTGNPPHAGIADSKLFGPVNSKISQTRFLFEADHSSATSPAAPRLATDAGGDLVCNRWQIPTGSAGTAVTI